MLNRITLQSPVPELLFWKFFGQEELCSPFAFTVILLSKNFRINRDSLLGKPLTITIPTGNLAGFRHINGKITRVSSRPTELNGLRYAEYILTLEPDVWPMMRDRDQRIFQGLTTPQIIRKLLDENQVEAEYKLHENYHTWEYCVQYQESSFQFISRLMELEGISYHFRHEHDRHIMVLTDSTEQSGAFPGYEIINYIQTPSGADTTEEGICLWEATNSVTPGLYTLDDYDFRKPNAWMLQARQNPVSPQPGSIDVYDWPGHYVESAQGESYARIRQERWQVEHQQIQAMATAIGVTPGFTFTLTNAPFADDNGEYLVTKAEYDFEENRYASGNDGETRHLIHFSVIPSSVIHRPAQKTPWPRTCGPQTAKVVGPEGESIWTDKYGRVKVKFHWDRQSNGDDTSSCWIRVSSAWAGQGYGSIQIPRVGDEVVIDFINGDPDRPVIIGRMYNESYMPPWSLPGSATQMGFYSRSKGGNKDNANILRFEDKAGKEQIWIHAEKNMDTAIESCETHSVGVNRKRSVGQDENVKIKRDLQVNVGADSTHNTGNKHTINVGEGKTVLTMDKDGNTLLEADTSIKLQVKDNYILITPALIEIMVGAGKLSAESIDEASFKGKVITKLGDGTNTELKANDTVTITGTNLTDIKGAIVKINS